MARRASNNPRQVRSHSCGCAACREAYPEPQRPERKNCVGSWQARYRDDRGKQKAKNFDRKNEAQAFLDEVRAKVRSGSYFDPSRGDITVADWYAAWWPTQEVQGRVTTRSRKISTWRAHIAPRWGHRKLRSLSYMEIQSWLGSEVRGHTSQKKALELLKALLRDAVRDQRIPMNPAAEVVVTAPPPAKHQDDLRPPTEDQYAAIRAHLPEQYRPVLDFALETGMRWGEYSGLRLGNVDLAGGTASVREVLIDSHGRTFRQAAPKTAAGFRTVPLTSTALDAVLAMVERWSPAGSVSPIEGDGAELHAEELLFRGGRGGALNRNNFRRVWLPAIQAAGVARTVVNPETGRREWWPRVHDARHYVASRLHAAGVSERDVQTILGQERGGRVTWLYTHGTEDSIGAVRSALETGRVLRVVS